MSICFLRKSSGFSLLEVVVVLALLSIFTLIVASRFTRPGVDLAAKSQVLKSHIRYSQARALNTNRSWGIRYHTDITYIDNEREYKGAYWLFADGDHTKRIILPGETEDLVKLGRQGIAIAEGSFILTFDTWGRPAWDLDQSGDLHLNLTKTGQADRQIRIVQNTGFIQ